MIHKRKQFKNVLIAIAAVLYVFLSTRLSFAQIVSPTLTITPMSTTVTTQQLISNEATYFTHGTEVTVNKSLTGNISSNPDQLSTLSTVDNKGNSSIVKAYIGDLFVDSSFPVNKIPMYTTSKSVEGNIMAGISGETSTFKSISGVVKKVLMPGGYYYYAFEINNVQLQTR